VKLLGRKTYKLRKRGQKAPAPQNASAGKRKRCPTCGAAR